jgi:hypothetical protein
MNNALQQIIGHEDGCLREHPDLKLGFRAHFLACE